MKANVEQGFKKNSNGRIKKTFYAYIPSYLMAKTKEYMNQVFDKETRFIADCKQIMTMKTKCLH